jgi:hypothetical protein
LAQRRLSVLSVVSVLSVLLIPPPSPANGSAPP